MNMRLIFSTALLVRNVSVRTPSHGSLRYRLMEKIRGEGNGNSGHRKGAGLVPTVIALCPLSCAIKSSQSTTISTRLNCLFHFHLAAGLILKFGTLCAPQPVHPVLRQRDHGFAASDASALWRQKRFSWNFGYSYLADCFIYCNCYTAVHDPDMDSQKGRHG